MFSACIIGSSNIFASNLLRNTPSLYEFAKRHVNFLHLTTKDGLDERLSIISFFSCEYLDLNTNLFVAVKWITLPPNVCFSFFIFTF